MKDEHLDAASLHEAAAKSHRTAAEYYGKGDTVTANQHAAEAFEHSLRAYAASKNPSTKSTHHQNHA